MRAYSSGPFCGCCASRLLRVARGRFFDLAWGMDADAWLGVEVISPAGTAIELGPRIDAAIRAAIDGKALQSSDVPAEGVLVEDALFDAMYTVLQAALGDGAKIAKVQVLSSDVARYRLWLEGRYKVKKDVPSKPEDVAQELTDELKEDLRLQGMSAFDDIKFVELSLFLGRPVSKLERSGGAYNAPPTMMTGAIAARKSGAKTFDDLLERCYKSNDLAAVDTWINTLSHRCTTSQASPYAGQAANRFRTWWSKACRLNAPRAVLWYVMEYRANHPGRGLPFLSDPELLALADRRLLSDGDAAITLSQLATSKAVPASTDGGSTVSGVTSSSGLGSSISSSQSATLDRLANTIGAMSDGLASITSRLDRLEEGGAKGEPGGADRPPGSCFICHSTKHRIQKCPKLPKDMKDAMKAFSSGDDA